MLHHEGEQAQLATSASSSFNRTRSATDAPKISLFTRMSKPVSSALLSTQLMSRGYPPDW